MTNTNTNTNKYIFLEPTNTPPHPNNVLPSNMSYFPFIMPRLTDNSDGTRRGALPSRFGSTCHRITVCSSSSSSSRRRCNINQDIFHGTHKTTLRPSPIITDSTNKCGTRVLSKRPRQEDPSSLEVTTDGAADEMPMGPRRRIRSSNSEVRINQKEKKTVQQTLAIHQSKLFLTSQLSSDVPAGVAAPVSATGGSSNAQTGRKRGRSKKKKKNNNDKQRSVRSDLCRMSKISQIEITEDMLHGIEECGFLNAAESWEALNIFFEQCRSSKYALSWTIVFADEHFSTPFLQQSKRSCHDKASCEMWNCPCDSRRVRAAQVAGRPVFCVMFALRSLKKSSSQSVQQDSVYILPLCPAMNGESSTKEKVEEGYEFISKWPLLPFTCGVPLKDRWDTFRNVLMINNITCVTYNAAVGLMPLHRHRSDDLGLPLDLVITSSWDLRVAAWMLRPDAKEADLEFDAFIKGAPHLCSSKTQMTQNSSSQMKTLAETKDKLSDLLSIYFALDRPMDKHGLKSSFRQIEGPLQSMLSAMEFTGIGFLPEVLSDISTKLEQRIDELTNEAKQIAKDESFLCSSPQQVAHLLYDVLKIPTTMLDNRLSSSQNRSTSESVLEQLKETHPYRIIELLLEFRTIHKLLTSFIRPLPHLSRKDLQCNYRIHPIWIQTAVRTGRLSCRKPNMQQIPKDSVFQVFPRNAFCSTRPETCLFSFDYSQNEVRILAHVSADEQLMKLFGRTQSGEYDDIYKQMSSVITGKPVTEVSDEERAITKQVILAILYGMGIAQVAKKLKISKSRAFHFSNSFFQRFRQTKMWIEKIKNDAKKNGFITTMLGRRRYLEDINSHDKQKVANAERQAVNSVIQGSAADLMKLSMLKIGSYIMRLSKRNLEKGTHWVEPKILLSIHDELLFEVADDKAEINQFMKAIQNCCVKECEHDLKLRVPLKLNCCVGKFWGDMKPCN